MEPAGSNRDRREHPDLIWAIRGGGASVGIVTELEFEASGFDTAYAGVLAWDLSYAETVLPVWATWEAHAPRKVTTSLRLLALPPLPIIPAELRARRLVMIDGLPTDAVAAFPAVDGTAAAVAERDVARVMAALHPWANGKTYLNFVERPFDTSTAFTLEAWARLQRLRATYDPRGVLHTFHAAPAPDSR